MVKRGYIENTKGAKERFDRAMQAIFQAPKRKVEKPKKDASDSSSERKRGESDKG
jgi:hypothetical protein